jgi:glycosyltransferase involved in cell wall biosynthesis
MSVQAAVSALPHLPKSTRAIYRCSNITRHAYDIVTEHLPYAHRVVATSKRQFDDLSRQRGVPVNKLRLIPHGADTSAFVAAYQSRATEEGPIRLVYLGRLLDSAKGIFLLPRIASRLERLGVAYTLTVIGDGPDRGEFERRFADRSTSPVMLGSQPHAAVPGLLASADVLLMPSRFEGFGFSLIEAMAAGVVPIVARVVGVTDWIVDDQETGFVCGIDDADAFARQVADLAGDRQRWAQMSRKAHGVASEKFGLARLGRDYDDLFREVLSQPADTPDPRPWSAFRASPAFEPTFRRYIPEGIKARLRSWSERLRGWRGT